MKKEIFINKAKENGVRIKPKSDLLLDDFDVDRLNEFRRLKQFIPYINFDCQIKKSGGCKSSPTTIKCCCYSCIDNVGFLRMIIDSDLTYYSRRFSVKTGFWRKGKGCVLPHKMRSTTCLTHHCNYEGKEHEGFSAGLFTIRNKLHDLRVKI